MSSISGIGTSFQYLYDSNTKKLQCAGNGGEDEFTKWFNGETKDEELSENLNGFDYKKKRDIQNMFMVLSATDTTGRVMHSKDGNGIYEVSGELIDAMTSEYSIDGRKVFKAYDTPVYRNDEIQAFSTDSQPYKTHTSKPYDAQTNSLNIAVGDSFRLGNGYSLKVDSDNVQVAGYGSGSGQDDERADILAWGMNALIHFADQQWFADKIDAKSTPMVLELLRNMGVDTSKEFEINGTKCEVRDGRIREVGNTHVVPGSIYNEAVKRYEEALYMPLRRY